LGFKAERPETCNEYADSMMQVCYTRSAVENAEMLGPAPPDEAGAGRGDDERRKAPLRQFRNSLRHFVNFGQVDVNIDRRTSLLDSE
jgi:hypothetical protein